jgi:hypothetical protein
MEDKVIIFNDNKRLYIPEEKKEESMVAELLFSPNGANAVA